jgi:type IV secretory pathway VirB2 component (pilin)
MKFINLLSVFIFIISQNILMASSAYAADYTATLVNKDTTCNSACSGITGSDPVTGDNQLTISLTNAPPAATSSFISTTPNVFTFTGSGALSNTLNLNAVKSYCAGVCEAYKSDSGLTLGNLDAVSNLSSNTLAKAMCNAFRIVTGGAGKTFASFAVIATGIGFFTGKVSWGLMIGVAAGIATMFGASSIVAAISGESVNTQCGLNFKQ